jgi:hypothetical protein
MNEVTKTENAVVQVQAPLEAPTQGGILAIIGRMATDPAVDIDKLDRLLAMHERIRAHEAAMAYAQDLSALQGELPAINERGQIVVNGQVRSRYAKFEDINEAVKPLLKAHGFAISFSLDTSEATLKITGHLLHRLGHREQTTMVLPADNSGNKNVVQGLGSSVSYAKRYVLCAMLNISTAEDDDGQGKPVERITEQQAADLKALIEEVQADEKAYLKYLANTGQILPPGESLADVRADAYKGAVQALEMKRKRKAK